MALAYLKKEKALVLLILASLSAACCAFFCKSWISHKRSILVIEPEVGPRKLRCSEQRTSDAEVRGQVLYNSLRGKGDWEVKALSKTKLLSKPETPISGIRAGTKASKGAKATANSKLEVRFEEGNPKYQSAPPKVYRVKVAPVRDAEEALKLWSVVKSKNPMFFDKFNSLLDKVTLPDGKVVHYLSMGDYKEFKVARLVSKKLEAAGYRALIYELAQ